ncbi:hypothetical protein NTK89_001648 [Vibrio fluvialis]|nr:hypothetical protein [Vibrio fluvialis]
MTTVTIYGYDVSTSDLLSTIGVILTTLVALAAIFLTHYFSNHRLRAELTEQNRQRELERISRLKEDKLKRYLQKMEIMFLYNLELKSICKKIRMEFFKVDDIDSAFSFSEYLHDISHSISEIENKMNVIINVYFYNEAIDFDTFFISTFTEELINYKYDFGNLKFEEFSSLEEASETLETTKNNFDTLLNDFVLCIHNLETEFVMKTDIENESLYESL